ncbi:glucose/sorbosone dehydrogenase [Frankia torreyi]|uniref:Glucose/sorbosone dehydrogenase n=1 Tax=Frankia torreyi TaxID=1856 RepID=A0A0D8B8N2_9ACTN|nr:MULTISPECIES: PQQ-dependent sugar dehydrogenase [Frankia]KJE20465.1 glucose/sorbosone dehydrogenase [Frankia torreyi]KQM02978.1 glucose/sorbosone dehydrogenase [Frankia sp. CpI1-P]
MSAPVLAGRLGRAGPRREGRERIRRLILLTTALAVVGVGVVACGGGSEPAAGAAASTQATAGPVTGEAASPRSGATRPGASEAGAAGAGTAAPGLRTVVTGLAAPWDVAFLPSGEALISERDSGRIIRLPAGGGRATEVARLPGVVHRGESGLLGLAVSPSFATDRLVYAYYTSATDNRIVRFRLSGDRAEAPTPILTGLADAAVHNGGRIRFGPDGLLYAGVGDAGVRSRAQDRSSLNGKILRMRPDGGVPPGNPFPSSLVYSLGHRNVQGLAWDSAGRLWASEFGQDRLDEINLIVPGGNYGWPGVEGTGDTDGGRLRNPLATWTTAEASPSGIAIRGDTLYVAALRGQRLWELDLAGTAVRGRPRALFTGELGRLRAAVAAPDGSVWLLTNNTDGRGAPKPGDDRIVALR